MQIGIGLPNVIPGTAGRVILDWARHAEERGFSSLATLDRIVYPNYDTLITLAAVGAVTRRIGLLTDVLLAPTRNPILLAKEAASVDQLSGGRLTLGVGVGGREDDFVAAEQDFHTRGRRWDAALPLIHRAWDGEPVAGNDKAIGPKPVHGRVPLLIGGNSDEAVERTVRWGTGWTAGGGGPDQAAPFLARIRAAWQAAGRAGQPRFVALAYFALGPDAGSTGPAYLHDYYGTAPWVEHVVNGMLRTPEALQGAAARFAEVGFDELIFMPTVATADQVALLADTVLNR
jgi:alkanesulfonate monooxygenase SsuD/methylene tetrahydromethanopterin reductase-like flavin-dependent oxidoreductase (luciferase family)